MAPPLSRIRAQPNDAVVQVTHALARRLIDGVFLDLPQRAERTSERNGEDQQPAGGKARHGMAFFLRDANGENAKRTGASGWLL